MATGDGTVTGGPGWDAEDWVVKVPVVADEGVRLPEPAHEGDAGTDIRIIEDIILYPHARRQVRTGLRFAIPVGYVGLCFPRNTLAVRLGISLANCVAVISPGSHGEVMAVLENKSERPVRLHRGERVFQLIVMPHPAIAFVPVDGFGDGGEEDGD